MRPYSEDLRLRVLDAVDRGTLVEAISWAFDAMTVEDTWGWFGHCAATCLALNRS